MSKSYSVQDPGIWGDFSQTLQMDYSCSSLDYHLISTTLDQISLDNQFLHLSFLLSLPRQLIYKRQVYIPKQASKSIHNVLSFTETMERSGHARIITIMVQWIVFKKIHQYRRNGGKCHKTQPGPIFMSVL